MARFDAFVQWALIIAAPYGLWVVYEESGTWFFKFWAVMGILTLALKSAEFRYDSIRASRLPPL